MIGFKSNARSDLFAFGAMLYEMVTGRRAFTGDTPQMVMLAVLDSDPPAIRLSHPAAPPLLDYIVERCLAKEAEDRWASAHDVALCLRSIATATEPSSAKPSRVRIGAWVLAAAIVIGILGLAGRAAFTSRSAATGAAAARVTFVLPSTSGLEFRSGTIAPDGRSVSYVASGTVWVRPLDTLEPRQLMGTDGAYGPFWSPDSRTIAFFSGNQLKRVDAAGGPVSIVAYARRARGGTWSDTGNILFSADSGMNLYRISATGGEPELVRQAKTADGETALLWPYFLPGGDRFGTLLSAKVPTARASMQLL